MDLDAALFEASADGLYFKQGMALDFESGRSFQVGVSVFDPTVVSTSAVTNGGFETGDKSGWWLQGDLGWPGKWSVVSDVTRSGGYSLFADNWARTVSHTFASPLGAADVVDFSFWTQTSTEARTVVTLVYESGTQSHMFATAAGVWEQRQLQPLVRPDLGRIKSFSARTFHVSANQDDVDTYYDDFNIRTAGSSPVVAGTPLTITVTDVNEPATGLSLNSLTPTLFESVATTTRIKVADIVIVDDALGTNAIMLSGGDAESFEIDGLGLYLKAGTQLDYAAQALYQVTISVIDGSLQGAPMLTADFTLSITSDPARVRTPVESDGQRTLQRNSSGQLFVDGTPLMRGGKPVTIGGYPTVEFLAAETVSGVNRLLFREKQTGIYRMWRFDSNWVATGVETVPSPSSPAFSTLELAFQTDLDQDGSIG